MAARLSPAPFSSRADIVDLRRVAPQDLHGLLEEESEAWIEEIEWDFRKSADLVRRFVGLHVLNGFALLEDGCVTGYLYYVLEERKGLIGDLYVRKAVRTPERETRLLEAALEAMMAGGTMERIESQLMMMAHRPGRTVPFAQYARSFDRDFMRADLSEADLSEGRVRRPMYIDAWSDHYQEASAQLIAEAYAGHVDSQINDQYRNAAGARRFLYNIVQYPGCGTFYRPASWVALEAETGRLCGVSLASMVSPGAGHITQICVSPSVRGTGIGHALLRRSLIALAAARCRSVSLTVTASNRTAAALYERVGFRTVRQFSAYVWDGFSR